MPATSKLTAKQQRFVEEYLVDLNATQAAIRAGYSKKTASQIGEENLRKPDIQAAIQRRMDERSERLEIKTDDVLRKWWELVNADPRELVQYIRGACDGCWGGEIRDEINEHCEKCGGRGKGHVVVSDTRDLSPAALALYAGVKVGRDGIEVKMHDQMAALVNVAKHKGMFVERHEVSGAPIQVVVNRPNGD